MKNELKVFQYYFHVGPGWGVTETTWFSVFATDKGMVKDFIEQNHVVKGYQNWREVTGCWLKCKPATDTQPSQSYIIP